MTTIRYVAPMPDDLPFVWFDPERTAVYVLASEYDRLQRVLEKIAQGYDCEHHMHWARKALGIPVSCYADCTKDVEGPTNQERRNMSFV